MSHRYLYGTVFVTGAASLVLELTASRMLTPYFGASMFVWANVIGIVLIALSLGYAVGGRLADKWPHAHLFYLLVFISGAFVSLSLLLARVVLSGITGAFDNLQIIVIFGSFLAIVLLFAVPIFFLGIISPFAVRLVNEYVSTTGRTAGSLYSFSTIGSIVGTFSAAFVFIPFVGVVETMTGCAVLLMLLGALGTRWKKWLWIAAVVPIGLYFVVVRLQSADVSVVFEADSVYQHIRVFDTPEEITLVTNEGGGVQSAFNKKAVLTGSHYWDYLGLMPALREGTEKNVLLLGLAGGTVARIYDHYYSESYALSMKGVEIDPVVVQVARQYFELDDFSIDVVVGDARLALVKDAGEYDVIVVDAYTNQMYIPFHMATVEFFQEVSEHLLDNGIVAANIASLSEDAGLLRHIAASAREVFPYVYIAPVAETGNYLLLASSAPLRLDDVLPRVPKDFFDIFSTFYASLEEWEGRGELPLYDNKAPVEILTDSLFLNFIGAQLQ